MTSGDDSSNGVIWDEHDLDEDNVDEEFLLSVDGKEDGGDHSLAGVREGRFANSYMVGTNGGATYEDDIRPTAPKPGDVSEQQTVESPDKHPEMDSDGGLQNVHGRDDRQIVRDTSRIPARSIGLLRILYESGKTRYGTAWLIGPRTLATAAHNLLDPREGRAKKLAVGLGFDGQNPRGGWHRIVDARYPSTWSKSPSAENPHDFAVIKIENPKVGNRFGRSYPPCWRSAHPPSV